MGEYSWREPAIFLQKMSQSWRHSEEPGPSTTPTSSTLSSILMTTAGPSHLVTFPTNNAVMFAPHMLSTSSVGALPYPPFSFMTPSGQVLLSAQLPYSPAVPLPLLTNPNLLPRLPGSTGIPFSILAPPLSLNHPLSTVQNTPMVSVGMPLQSSAVMQYPFVTTTQADIVTLSSTVTPTLKRPISHSTPQPPPISEKTRPKPTESSPSPPFRPTPYLQSESPRSKVPSVVTKMHSLSQSHPLSTTKEHSTSSGTGSLMKKLLVREPSTVYDPMNEKLQGEPDLTLVYKCFSASPQAEHMYIEVLPSQGNLKWLHVRQKAFYIDPELGPIVVARIIVSSNRIAKFQILFPIYRTVFTKLFVEQETENFLSELSTDHVICPGLLNYSDKFSVLGYHPSHVRIIETCNVTRYDHEQCPIWHVPSGTFSKRDRTAQKMCKLCKYLQNSVVRLATKACEVDPAERESWTDPSSNRPLAYMSAADREERYRKLRQERNQMLVKLRMYEERLGIGSGADVRHSGMRSNVAKGLKSSVGRQSSVAMEFLMKEQEDEGEEGGGGGEGSGERGGEGENPNVPSSESEASSDKETSDTTTDNSTVYRVMKRRSSEVVTTIRGKQPAKRIKSTST